jgi:hypothetical protein
MEQELLTLPEHLSSLSVFSGLGIKNELNIDRIYTEMVVYLTTRTKEHEDM